MTHRRAFLKQAGGALGATALAPLIATDRAMASTTRGLAAEVSAGTLDAASLGEEYLLGPDVSYLNHASIGTIPRAVHEAHKAYLSVCETNPWLYMWGGAWEAPRENVRALAAETLGCAATEVAITHNTTEGFSLLAQGLPLGPGDEVLFSSLNHDGASVGFTHHAATRGYSVRTFPFPLEQASRLSAADIVGLHVDAIRPETRALVFPHVDNIVGIRHPLAELSAAAHDRGVEFVAVDGAQTVGMIGLELAESGVDFYAASPHKWVQCPKGLGLFYLRAEHIETLRPMWVTWGQRRWAGTVRRFEDYGTRNFPALLALGDALEFQAAIGQRAKDARYRHMFETLRAGAERSDAFSWASPPGFDRRASLVAISIDGLPAGEFSSRMQTHGFIFRPFEMPELNSVRISPNMMTSEEELMRFFEIGSRILKEG